MKNLDAFKALSILLSTLLGSGGAFGLWKLFTGDFLQPYREDQRDLRDRLEAAEDKAQDATDKAQEAIMATRRCEEREAHLRIVLIGHGIDVGEDHHGST